VIIGVAGKSGAGKTTVAEIITKILPDSRIFSLSDPLMKMALAIDPLIEGTRHLSDLVALPAGWDGARRHPEVRRFLQRLGTDGVRNCIHEDTWVDMMMDAYIKEPMHVTFIVPNIRFENEAQTCDFVIVVERPNAGLSGENASHVSEQYEPIADAYIWNDGTLEDLERKVATVLSTVEEYR
jgi:energy-coupling factor transporter ATP-binding protein EcfA2